MLKFVMIQIPRKTEQWAKAALAAFISGAANSFLSAVGISTINAVIPAAQIKQLDGKQLLDMAFVGGLVGLFMYLKQSPVPPDSGNTEQFVKPIDSTQKQP